MAGSASSIIKGFDYQHLTSWYYLLSLKRTGVVKIGLENSEAGHVDDLTVYKADRSVDFYQIKYHVNAGAYSIETMLVADKGNSLMEKFWITWKKLITTYPKDKIRLILYSNWVQHPEDEIFMCINGENGYLDNKFYDATAGSACGKKRIEWMKKHGVGETEFYEFTRSISFFFGRYFTEELKRVISERMELCKLKNDDNALLIGEGIVKAWIKDKTEVIDLKKLEEKLNERNLYLPEKEKNSAAVYFVTIKDRRFDLDPDFILDWRKYFKDNDGVRSHELIDKENWNKTLLPELKKLEQKINRRTGATLIKARGYSRLSPWFAFGQTFSEVSGYQIEINQQDNLWQTDLLPNADFKVISENGAGETFSHNTGKVAVGISVTGNLSSDVRTYISNDEKVDALLLLRPERELGPGCFQTGSDVTSFANQIKEQLRQFVKANKAEKLLLFYWGPLSGACFIGHKLNAVCKEIQIMENKPLGGYIKSFVLS